jgi:hypothetical protein
MEYNPSVLGQRSLRAALILVIVVYLTAAGWFFVLAPWSRFWAVRVVPGAPFWVSTWLDHPAFRGALSGFGLVHFAAAWSWLERAMRKT